MAIFEQNEMLATLVDVSERLQKLGIDHMVTGSFAMSAYVPARITMDIDIVVEIKASDALRFESMFLGDYYVSASSITRACEQQSMFNIVSNSTLVKVDCIIRKHDRFEVERFERRRKTKVSEIEFWVIGKEDLILSKLKWASGSHSERQFEDVLKLIESGADVELLKETARKIGLVEVWDLFEKWTTQAGK